MENSIKLQAFLAHAGISSRRAAEVLISEGKVRVNDETAHIGQRIDPDKDTVSVRGKIIKKAEQNEYFIVNKPVGLISTTKDELNRGTVLKLLPSSSNKRLYPVGRLDAESEGLLLLTNDGELTYLFTHPKFKVRKTYHVLIEGIPSTPALEHLKRGIKIGSDYVEPVKTSVIKRENENTWLEIVIAEGKKHQIRKMMARTGYEVIRLKRVTMGPLALGELKVGEARKLSDEEMSSIEKLKNELKAAIQRRKK
jgi:23S rRNA pseudouridine2605 synthase